MIGLETVFGHPTEPQDRNVLQDAVGKTRGPELPQTAQQRENMTRYCMRGIQELRKRIKRAKDAKPANIRRVPWREFANHPSLWATPKSAGLDIEPMVGTAGTKSSEFLQQPGLIYSEEHGAEKRTSRALGT